MTAVRITGAQFTQLRVALGSAFPRPGMIREMLRVGMDVDLEMVAGGENYAEVLFELITWAESEGRVSELLARAVERKPGNADLRRFSDEYSAAVAKSPPGSVDLSRWVSIHDQGADETVAAMAVVTAMETSLARQGHPDLLSTRWLYWKAKQHDELQGHGGTWLTTTIYAAEQFGVPLESAWPYSAGDRKPPPEALTTDTTGFNWFRLRSYRVETLDDIPEQLALVRPVVVGVALHGDVWFHVDGSGWIPPPLPASTVVGGHAVTLVGFNPVDESFRFANTWGADWGSAGFGIMGREAAAGYLYQDQMWAIHLPVERGAASGDPDGQQDSPNGDS